MRVGMMTVLWLSGFAASPVTAGEGSFDSNGTRIHYHEQGKGDAVVLIHGFSLSAAEMWLNNPAVETQFASFLAKDFRVIALDLRGHGQSAKPHDRSQYGVAMAEDVIRLLDHLEIPKAHILGYSLGASVAGKVMVSHPQRCLSVIFAGGGPWYGLSKKWQKALDATVQTLEQGKGFAPLMLAIMPEDQPKPSPEQAAGLTRAFLRGKDSKALAAVMASRQGLGVSKAQLQANQIPVLYVHGSEEGGMILQLCNNTLPLLKGARKKVIQGANHGNTPFTPSFQKAVIQFLKSQKN